MVVSLEANWPRSFGRYTLLAPLAQGGMGEVCLALAGALSGAERLCVVKTIRPDLAGDPEFIGRFMDEGRVVCALSHPNIAQVLEVGVEDGIPFVAMEYVAGEDMDRVLQAAQRVGQLLPVDFVLTCIAGVLEGLAYAHRATSLDGAPLHIVHRDISPQNVRVSWDGDVKVLDFGTARAAVRQTQTMHGVVFGKPGYMAPEQARGEDLDHRADLHALGIVTWELLAGAEMARERTARHMEALAHGELVIPPLHALRADVPPEIDGWIAQLTRYHRDERFPDAQTARRALLAATAAHRIRIDREVVIEVLERLLPDERETSRSYVTALVAQGRAARSTTSDKVRVATTEAPVYRRVQSRETAAVPDEPGVIPGTRYRPGERLGAGGMGEVFAAEHVDLGRRVALKVLYVNHSQDPDVARRFRLEARAIASLSHPNLVQVLDFGTTADGRLFYAMERLVGETLRARMRSQGRLPPAEVVRIGAAVARGLAAAHAAGLVHRDLKPENVFLAEDGGIKLLDFGVAKTTDPNLLGGDISTTRAGELFGSPAYMAPEQASGKPVDLRTDLYSLGAVLYEALTAAPVFEAATVVELLARQLAEPPKPLSERAPDARVPRALERVVMACLAKNPADRPRSATELAERLERGLSEPDEPPVPAVAVVSPEVTVRLPRRAAPTARARVLLGAAAAATVVVGGAVVLRLGRRPAPTATVTAERGAGREPGPSSTAASHPAAATEPAVDATVAEITPDGAGPSPAVGPAAAAPGRSASVAARPSPRAAPSAVVDHFALAQRALQARRFDVAITEANLAISARQNAVEARNLLGQAYLLSGQRPQAIAQWRMVLAREPTNARARTLLRAAGEDPDPL